jgi:tetratricopeptide (TPR) repeat protein
MSHPFPRALRASLTLVAALALSTPIAIGCATSDEESKPVTYSLTAKQNYEKGLAELKDENFPEAQKYFQFVKQKYPFSKFAVLAELGIADTQFARGNYIEAIDSYKSFARLHPTHEKGGGRVRRLPHLRELLQGHARGRAGCCRLPTRRISRRSSTRSARSKTSARSSRPRRT